METRVKIMIAVVILALTSNTAVAAKGDLTLYHTTGQTLLAEVVLLF